MLRRAWPWLLAAVVLVTGFRELFAGGVQAAKDLSGHVFPETYFLVEQWTQGRVPLWLPHARLGQPFLALLYTQVFYLPRVLTAVVFGHVVGPNVLHLLHAAWAFAGLFFAARRFGLARAAAFVAAAPFSISPFFSEFAQNLSFASSAAWAGWVLWAAEGVRRAPGLRAAAWLALVLGASFHAGSPEMWLWEALLAGFVVLGARKAMAWGALGVAWAGALSAVVALPALELSREFTKAGEATGGAMEWSVSWTQLLSIAVPDADLPRAGAYWGGDDQRFLFTLFIGSAAVLLAALGATSRRARPVLALTAVCLVLALGKHFIVSEALLSVPPFKLFRYPAKYAVGALFGLSVLAGFGARRLVALRRRRSPGPTAEHRSGLSSTSSDRPGWVGLLPLALVTFALGVAASALWPWPREGFRDHAWWLVLFTGLLALAHRKPTWIAAVVALELIAAPVQRWDRLPASALMTPSRLAPQLRDTGRLSIRVDLDDMDPEACGPWDREGDPLLEGRDRLAALRFVEEELRATGGYGFRDPWRLKEAFARGEGAFVAAGVNTFVRETRAPAPPGATRVDPSPIEDVWVWRSPHPDRRGAFFTKVRVADESAAFDALLDVDSVQRELVVEHGEPLDGPPCAAEVVTSEFDPRTVKQHVVACAPGAVLLADAWFPGWRVEVDGVEAEPLRAWGFLRAVRVPAGEHEIRWRYEPRSFFVGAAVSLVALLALFITLATSRARFG